MEIAFDGQTIEFERGIAGFSLIQSEDEDADQLFCSIDAAASAGYDTLETRIPMILSFLNAGRSAEQIAEKFSSAGIKPTIMTCLEPIDIPNSSKRDELLTLCEKAFDAAKTIGCKYIQAIARDYYKGQPWAKVRKETARGLREIAVLSAKYGIGIAYEPCATFPVGNVEQGIEVIEEAACSNVGLIIDTYHFHVGGSKLETIYNMDNNIVMPTFHMDDAVAPPEEYFTWSDHDRYAFPGDGIVPVKDITRAILEVGYKGTITDEVLYYRYTHWDRERLAKSIKEKGDLLLKSL